MNRYRARHRRHRLIAAAVAAACALPAAAPVQAQEAQGLRQTGRIIPRLDFQTRFLEVDPSARRLFEVGQPPGSAVMTVNAYDLDTLKLVGSIPLGASQSGFGGKLTAIDELRHRMFVLFPVKHVDLSAARGALGASGGIVDQTTRTTFGIAVVDTLRLRLLGIRLLGDLFPVSPFDTSNSNRIGIKAMSYFPTEEKIYLLSETTTVRTTDIIVGEHTVFVHEVNASPLLDPAVASVKNWSHPIPQCAMAMARNMTSAILRSSYRPAVFFPCRGGDVLGVPIQGEVGGMVRVAIRPGLGPGDTSNFTTDFFPISGNLKSGVVAVDPVVERFFVGADVDELEPRVWIFDTRSAAWIGLIVTPSFWAIGIDRALGRLYTLSPVFEQPSPHIKSVVASTRSEEADQGVLASFKPLGAPDFHRPVVDSVRHRIFWPGHDDYFVIEDTIPGRRAAGKSDPDKNTLDVAETRQTAANFLGGGRGYGTRIRAVGGWRAPERNLQTVYPPLVDAIRSSIEGGAIPQIPEEGTRDFHLARVIQATVANGEATAEAIGADRDRRATDEDVFHYTAFLRDFGGPDYTEERWPFEEASCADFGRKPDARSVRGASVRCARDRSEVKASASSDIPVDLPTIDVAGIPAVTIGYSKAWTGSKLDRRRGIVSTSEAEVRELEFDGRAGIGRIYAKAETWATGRPKRSNGLGAGSRYLRTIEDVWVTMPDGSRRTVCSDPCSPELVADALTKAIGARARVELPSPDPLVRGTPGGYEALVVRNPAERENDRLLNEEADNRLEVPALIVTAFGDGRVPSRLVVSLAAVAAESHYGIYLLSRDEPPLRDAILPPPPSSDLPTDTRVPPPPTASGPSSFVRELMDGLRVVFASPAQAVRAIGLLTFLVAPVVLLARRRFLRGGARP
ncbi:MAG: hypothetical protein ACRDJM_07220 [Actinomycetota bacterium]